MFNKLLIKSNIPHCPYCNSIFICWNWIIPTKYQNYIDNNFYHECWDCETIFKTEYKVKLGIPYKLLRLIYTIKFRLTKYRTIQFKKIDEYGNIFKTCIPYNKIYDKDLWFDVTRYEHNEKIYLYR